MDKQMLVSLLIQNYNSFISYINELTREELYFNPPNKWSASQQLKHIVLCTEPLVHVLEMDKKKIAEKFGLAQHSSRSYSDLLDKYKTKLKEGGKAPSRFLPKFDTPIRRIVLCGTLARLVHDLCSRVKYFREEDLDELCIPHPLLGFLTIREMLYNAIYHVEHHHKLAIKNLKSKTVIKKKVLNN